MTNRRNCLQLLANRAKAFSHPHTYKYVLALVIVITGLLAVFFPQHASADPDPAAAHITSNSSEPLVFLGNHNLPPMNYLDNGQAKGLVVDIVEAVAERMEQPVIIELMDWTEAQELVLAGEADALVQINATEERELLYDFSEPLLESEFAIFIPADKPGIRSILDLRNLTVATEEKGFSIIVLGRDPLIEIRPVPDLLSGFNLLLEGSVDAVVGDRWVGTYTLAENNIQNIAVTDQPVDINYSSIAVKKGNTMLLSEINRALGEIKEDGTYQQIIDRWQAKEVVYQTIEQVRQQRFLMVGSFVALLVALAFLLVLLYLIRKRKHVEKELRKTQFTVDKSPLSIFWISPQGRFTYTNEAAAEKLGYTKEELLSLHVWDVDPNYPEEKREEQWALHKKEKERCVESDHRRRDGTTYPVRVKIYHLAFEGQEMEVAEAEDITEQRQAEADLKRIEWMLSQKKPAHGALQEEEPRQSYGDLTALNKDGVILKYLGPELLKSLSSDYLELLGTSTAIYEANGDYALGIFTSGWCRLMDQASRNLCNTADDVEALNSGRWLCHESCWTDCSQKAILTGEQVDIECNGGIRLYAVPIFASGQVVGAISFGYGNPPEDPGKLEKLAKNYQVKTDELIHEAHAYDSRPPYIIEMAKKRLHATARLIGSMIEAKKAEEAISASEAKYREILATMDEGYYEVDLAGNLVFFNEAFCRLTGYSSDELYGKNYRDFYENPQDVFKVFNEVYRTGESVTAADWPAITRDGRRFHLELSIKLHHDKNGNPVGFRGVVRDITARRQADEKIRYLSYHDQLTGLYNRHFLEEEMKRLDTERQLPISVVMADLNGLKLVNDTYGHQSGDKMLKRAAEILSSVCRADDLLARFGGDEFVLYLPRTPGDKAQIICERIESACRNEEVDNVPLSLSTGLAVKTSTDQVLSDLLKEAENSMYREKLTESRSGKSAIVQSLLQTLAAKSFETETHTRNMQEVAKRIGKGLGLPHSEMHRLQLLITLHDIGKINIPEELLTRKGPLDATEWEIMKKHSETGYRVARATENFAHVAEDILAHHERWDGSGYPQGLRGEEIPLLARITALADAYEVMSHGRPYKTAMQKGEIVAELKNCASSQFDPHLTELFLAILENEALGPGH